MKLRCVFLLLSIIPSIAVAVVPDLSALTIRNTDDAARQRTRLTQLVFGTDRLPSVSPQVDGNRLFYQLPNGYASTAYLHRPAQPNQELLIYHHGHFTDQETAAIEQAILGRFLPAGFSVLFVHMPLYGPNADSRYPSPSNHNAFYPETSQAITFFLEPLVAFVNQLAGDYRRISMMGLSGGGWTTVMYAALDSRVSRSYPIAGSYPQYIVRQLPMTYAPDAEQTDSAIYSNIDYLDFYAIAGMSHQLQIYNYNDACCFQGDYSKQYEGAVANVVQPAGGEFFVYVDDNDQHSISDGSITLILNDLQNVQTPFRGLPAPIPGTIQAEDFDFGREGVAYHDLDARNWRDNVYRASAVEVAPTTDAGGGSNIGYTRASEWVEYTVNVSQSGSYLLEVRVASDGVGGTMHFEFDGVDKTGPLSAPDTGGWQSWTTLSSSVQLSAGTQVLRLVQDAAGPSGSVANINWMRLSALSSPQTPFGGTARSLPGTVQAEDFDEGGEGVAYHDAETENLRGNIYRASAVEVAATSDTGGGYNVGYTRADEWLEYTVEVAAAQTYLLEIRVASQGAGGTLHLEFDGVDRTGAIVVPDTGGWQNWTTLSRQVVLSAGAQTVRLSFDSVGASGSVANINWLRLTDVSGSALPGTLQVEDFDDGGAGVGYYDTDAPNNGGAYRNTGVDIQPTQDTGGGYDLGWTRPGEWLRYSVTIAAASFYTFEARVASDGVGGTFHVEVDGVDSTGAISVPDTGGWQNWMTLVRTGVYLPAGTHQLRLVLDTAGGSTGSIGNINWIRFIGP